MRVGSNMVKLMGCGIRTSRSKNRANHWPCPALTAWGCASRPSRGRRHVAPGPDTAQRAAQRGHAFRSPPGDRQRRDERIEPSSGSSNPSPMYAQWRAGAVRQGHGRESSPRHFLIGERAHAHGVRQGWQRRQAVYDARGPREQRDRHARPSGAGLVESAEPTHQQGETHDVIDLVVREHDSQRFMPGAQPFDQRRRRHQHVRMRDQRPGGSGDRAPYPNKTGPCPAHQSGLGVIDQA